MKKRLAAMQGETAVRIRDRLLITVFVAALVHGMIILGLTFGNATHKASATQGLDVLLTSDELPTADHNPEAAYLAQRTQLGAGNTREHVPLHNPPGTPGGPGREGEDDGSPRGGAQNGGSRADPRVIATTATNPDVLYFGATEGDEQTADRLQQSIPEGADQVTDDTGPVQLRGPQRDMVLAPDSRQYAYAEYLINWTRRVERVGTVNFPTAARRIGVTASPVIQIVIGANGRLRSARIQRSSGYPDLDQAALEILKLASPFDPFPPDMTQKTRTLGFAYEFRFTGGSAAAGELQAQAPSP